MEPSTLGAGLASGIATAVGLLFSQSDTAFVDVYSVNRAWNSYYSEAAEQGTSSAIGWNTPKQTVTAGIGRQSDVAIGKMFDLVTLGYKEDDLRLVAMSKKGSDETEYAAALQHEGKWMLMQSGKTKLTPIENASKDYDVIYKLNRMSLEIESYDLLKGRSGDLGKWAKMLDEMKKEGSLKGDQFPRTPFIQVKAEQTKADKGPTGD